MHKPNPETAALTEELGRWLTYPQAAEMVGVSERTLRRETAAGTLPLYRIGRARAYRLKTEDVAALVRQVA